MPNGSIDTDVPQVKYGINDNFDPEFTANGTSSTYTSAGIFSWFHDVVIKVNYSTTYHYQILPSLCVNASDTYTFRSQPAPNDSRPISITIVGDIGYDTKENNFSATKTINGLQNIANFTDLFLHVGDMSYADEPDQNMILDFTTAYYETRWNNFQTAMQPLTANNIYMTAPGNHEATCIQLFDCYCELINDSAITKQYRNFSAYLHRFSMPGGDQIDTYKNLWYSFDYGLAHIVVINTETDFEGAPAGPNTSLNAGNFRANGTQVRWLEADLKNATKNRCNVPWIIVMGHRPWYGSIPWYDTSLHLIQSDNCPSCREAFAQLLYTYKVDFYFSGHVHWYERLWPVGPTGYTVQQNYTEPRGPIYITTGAGGAPEKAQTQNIVANASAFYQPTYGFSHLQLLNSSTAFLSFYESENKGTPLENITIISHHQCTTSCSN
jgi:acid phosphatase